MAEYKKIKVTGMQDECCTITLLNAEGKNAAIIDMAMMEEMRDAAAHLRPGAKQRCKLLVFEGEGEHFSYGTSIQEHRAEQAPALLGTFYKLLVEIADLHLPTLAAVRGCCLGGAFELALLCQFIVCEETARFSLPEIKLGTLPPFAALLLPMRAGQAATDFLALTGAEMTASDAYRLGIAQQLCQPGNLRMDVEHFFMRHLAPRSALSLRNATKAARWEFNKKIREPLKEVVNFYRSAVLGSLDGVEGIEAYLGKRPPVWQNR